MSMRYLIVASDYFSYAVCMLSPQKGNDSLLEGGSF